MMLVLLVGAGGEALIPSMAALEEGGGAKRYRREGDRLGDPTAAIGDP